jgi:hypothetical protein
LRQRGETRYHSSTRLVGDDGLDGVARSAVVVAAFMAARRKAAGAGQGRESMRKGGEAARRQGGKGEYERQVKTRYSSGEINRWDAS